MLLIGKPYPPPYHVGDPCQAAQASFTQQIFGTQDSGIIVRDWRTSPSDTHWLFNGDTTYYVETQCIRLSMLPYGSDEGTQKTFTVHMQTFADDASAAKHFDYFTTSPDAKQSFTPVDLGVRIGDSEAYTTDFWGDGKSVVFRLGNRVVALNPQMNQTDLHDRFVPVAQQIAQQLR